MKFAQSCELHVQCVLSHEPTFRWIVERGKPMGRLILKRLAFAVPMLFLVSFFSFVLVSLSPTDPARIVAGPYADEARVIEVRTELGLDRPMITRYGSWVSHAVRGDFGTSITFAQGVPVRTLLNSRVPTTVSTVAVSLLVVTLAGLSLGVFSAVKGGSSGRAVSVFSLMGLAIPGFWLVLVLTQWFSVKWRLFPAIGFRGITDSPTAWLRALVLPVLVSPSAPSPRSRSKLATRCSMRSAKTSCALCRPTVCLVDRCSTAMH